MNFIIVLVILQGVLLASEISGQSSAKVRVRPCNTPVLKNGIVRLRSKGKFARFLCQGEFKLHGSASTMCSNGRWEGEIPICVAPGCADMVPPLNGKLAYLKRGSGAKLICNSRYELVGNDETFCDGIEWDRKIGSCRETNIASSLFCDFEGRLKCGWSNYLLNENDWLYTNMGRHGIGPQHDHTKMTKYEGFFMLLEGDSPRLSKKSYFFSPMYDADVSNNSCFKFYYHMYGVVTGAIRVFVKAANQSDSSFFTSLRNYTLLEITSRSSNAWIEALVRLPKLNDSFQIVIQGEIMRTQRTDLAIDDVEILDGAACEADRAVVTEKPEDESGGVFNVQSCQNRCGDTSPTSLTTTSTLKCDCHDGCVDEDTCCPDYEQFCIFGDSTIDPYGYTTVSVMVKPQMPKIVNSTSLPKTTTVLTSTASTTTTTTTTTTTPPTPITTRSTTTTRRPPVTTPVKTTLQFTTKAYRTSKRTPKPSTAGDDILEFDITTPHYMNDDSKSVELFAGKYDHKSEHLAKILADDDTGVSTWAIVTGIIISILTIGTVAGLYVYRERTRISNPAQMKKRYHCRSANEEFSEIRFLTEDEQLDFTMASPMND